MDCIIIGAGAAGLMAAATLSAAGKQVIVLEAAQRLGGRIHTRHLPGFHQPVEAGAEFVHGQLPLTLQLLQENNITYVPVSGSMWQKKGEVWQRKEESVNDLEEVLQQMNSLEEDMTISDFLYHYFSGEEHATLRDEVQRFAEGFDLADIFTASTFALREEWNNEAEEQYRIPGGYGQLITLLEKKCNAHGCKIITGCRIHHIAVTDKITAVAADGHFFTADSCIVAVPLGILQQPEDAANSIRFSPAIPQYRQAFNSMGYGTVIKIAIQFKQPLWESISSDVGFLLSKEEVPTWWTQLLLKNNLLTGWLGGPAAAGMRHSSKQSIYNAALQSLANLFDKTTAELEEQITAWEIFNWTADVFTAGAYSFSTVDTAAALQTIMEPVHHRLYFAGEAVYRGKHPGTVEAALESGKRVAEALL